MPTAGTQLSHRVEQADGWRLFVCALSAALALVWVAGPLFDGDIWWHVRLGNEILDHHSVNGTGLGWSMRDPADGSWTTTQWLAEVLMAVTHRLGGWAALGWLRLLGAALMLTTTWWAVVYRRSLAAATLPFCLAVLGSAIFVQDRPEQLTYILCPLVGWAVARFLGGGDLPHPAVVLVTVVVWAQFHPGWVLVPGLLAVLVVGAALDVGIAGISTPRIRRALWLFPASLVVGLLTPAGPGALTSASHVAAASRGTISEWQPAGFGNIAAVLLSLMVAFAVVSWAMDAPRPRRSELLAVAALAVFGVSAIRNTIPALLVLAPVVAARRELARSSRDHPEPRPASAIRARWRWSAAAVLALGVVWAAFIQAGVDPWSGDKAPTRILSEVQNRSPARVVTTYDLGGFFAGVGGPGVVVGIDGRTDYYGADYIRDYTAMIKAQPGWQDLFDALDPDVVVLRRTDALGGALETEGWAQVLSDKNFVMLEKGTKA